MDGGSNLTTPVTIGRSRYRVKIVVLCAVFLGCWFALRFHATRHWEYLFLVAAAAAIPVNYVRCERCHSSLYYRAGGTRVFFDSPTSVSFLWAKLCPVCGLERI